MRRERMVAIDPDESGEDYPNNVRPDGSAADDEPVWGIWETGPNSPPDGEWGWCPVGPFGMTAAVAEELAAQLDADDADILWPSLQDLTDMARSGSLKPERLEELREQFLWELGYPSPAPLGPFGEEHDEEEAERYASLLGILYDEDEDRWVLVEDHPWAAYASAVIQLETPDGPVRVHPAPAGQVRGNYPDPDGRMICVITACNPGGRTVTDEQNTAAQQRLESEIRRRGWTWWKAAGGDPSWEHVEASAAVIGAAEPEVVALGTEFGQEAIFVLTPAGRRIVGCRSGRELPTGWSIELGQA